MNIKMFFSLTSLFILILTSIPSHAQKVNRVEDVVEKTNKVSQNLTSRYARLESLLKAQDFRAADQETTRVMLAVANREGSLRIEDAEKFPCKELRSIDQLWLKYSGGKFGISVQQQIYQSLRGTKEFNRDVWRSMADRVGWRQEGKWLSYTDFNFTQTAPLGHLPTLWIDFESRRQAEDLWERERERNEEREHQRELERERIRRRMKDWEEREKWGGFGGGFGMTSWEREREERDIEAEVLSRRREREQNPCTNGIGGWLFGERWVQRCEEGRAERAWKERSERWQRSAEKWGAFGRHFPPLDSDSCPDMQSVTHKNFQRS